MGSELSYLGEGPTRRGKQLEWQTTINSQPVSQLSSWSQPAIAGIGDEAHGGDPSIGLAVRQGKLGIEVVADLGPDAADAVNVAAEKRLANALMRRLP